MQRPELRNSGLRLRQPASAPVRVIAVTGGKGGVGKTTIAVNLAAAMVDLGRRPLLFDGDLGLANVDILLGLTPRHTLAHVIRGERTLDEILVDTGRGFSVIPGGAGVAELARLGEAEHAGLVRSFSSLTHDFDTLIVDTAAGISPSVLHLAAASQHVLVTVCDDAASLADAYALVKVLSRNHGITRFHVVASMTRRPGSGRNLFDTLERVAARFLDVRLAYAGEIPQDEALRRAVRDQQPVVSAYPSSPSARALKLVAAAADTWQAPDGASGRVEFFADRLVGSRSVRMELVQ